MKAWLKTIVAFLVIGFPMTADAHYTTSDMGLHHGASHPFFATSLAVILCLGLLWCVNRFFGGLK